MKRLIAVLIALILYILIAAFVSWGFDPGSWSSFDRGMFAWLGMCILFMVAIAPVFDKRD